VIGNAISKTSPTSTNTTVATDTPIPTDTPAPTATPVPTPLTNKDAIANQLKADAANAQLQGDLITTGYGAKNNAFIQIGLNAPLTMSQSDQLSLVQTDCFNGQKAVWQDPLLKR